MRYWFPGFVVTRKHTWHRIREGLGLVVLLLQKRLSQFQHLGASNSYFGRWARQSVSHINADDAEWEVAEWNIAKCLELLGHIVPGGILLLIIDCQKHVISTLTAFIPSGMVFAMTWSQFNSASDPQQRQLGAPRTARIVIPVYRDQSHFQQSALKSYQVHRGSHRSVVYHTPRALRSPRVMNLD